ncbi:MAG: WYL domain-containing protein, partial [Enterocloster citroniae]|nr:WYL domain-containing protein [Enterocloster citroniae]
MAKSNNHKLALLYMMRELLNRTDEDHALNATDLIRILGEYGCEADRRTIYSNAAILEDFGLDIIKKEGRPGGYYIASRDFELPELKLLVDAVQSSKFITAKKSEQLIGKLMKLVNEQKAKELDRSIFIRNRMKSGNEKIFYNVDALHQAMKDDRQIRFQYGELRPSKRLVAKHDGKYYTASPWALTWDDENYYLIAHDEDDNKIKHFRVDKLMKIDVAEETRNGRAEFKDFDLAAFAKKTFGMYGGPDADVTFRCADHLAG